MFDATGAQYGAELERQLVDSLQVELPATINAELVERIQDTDIPDQFEMIEDALAQGVADGPVADVGEAVRRAVTETREEALRLDARASRLHGSMKVTGFAVSMVC